MTTRNVGESLVELWNTEQGSRLFVGKAGEITFHDRGRFLRDPRETTTQFAFSSATELGYTDDGLRITLDVAHQYDSAVVTREGGDPQYSQWAPGVTRRTLELTGLLLANDRLSAIVADSVVARYHDALLVVDEWEVQPELDADQWRALLRLERGDRVTLTLAPPVGDPFVFTMTVAKIAHTITADEWKIGFAGAPVDPFVAAGGAYRYFTFDGDGATQGFDVGRFR
jgi:hypothetical protein